MPLHGQGANLLTVTGRLVLVVMLLLGVTISGAAQTCTSSGITDEGSVDSRLVEETLAYAVYLPPCYDDTAIYPVIYLFHGSNSDQSQWAALGIANAADTGIALGYLPPLVIVMPHGDWMANENTYGSDSWEAIFLTELMPHIETTYAVAADKSNRAIGGVSRGGFWAYSIALRHPEIFSAVGGHSAFFDPQNAPPAINPLDLTGQADPHTRYWLDRGNDDYAAYGLDLMSAALPHARYTVFPLGDHSAAYWALHLPAYLTFYAAEWDSPPPAISSFVSPAPLYVPTTDLFSVRATLDSTTLDAALDGVLDYDLVLTPLTVQALRAGGFPIHPRTRLVVSDETQTVLAANPLLYTLRPLEELTLHERVLGVYDTPRQQVVSAFDWPRLIVDATRWHQQRTQLTRLTFSGVTALSRNMIPVLDRYGVAWAASAMQPYTQQSDFFHMSNEVSFAPRCPESDEPVLGGLCSRDAHFGLFQQMGADLIELTGNHNMDYNAGAYERTLAMFDAANMQTVGGGATLAMARQPLILTHNGSTIGLLACNWNGPDIALATPTTGGAAFCERAWLSAALPALKAQVDVVLVSVQYAEYDRRTPIERQVSDFQFVADLGADLVIGSQAHRPQTYALTRTEDAREVLLHYGLGNLYFDQPELPNRQFTLDTALVYQGRLVGLEVVAGVIEDVARPRWMTLPEERDFLEGLMLGR